MNKFGLSRRRVIRWVVAVLLVLSLAGWAWSAVCDARVQVSYQYYYVAGSLQWGVARIWWGKSRSYVTPGLAVTPNNTRSPEIHIWPDDTSNDSFWGFAIRDYSRGRAGLMLFAAIGFWFPTLVFAVLLAATWKRKKLENGRRFPVEIVSKE